MQTKQGKTALDWGNTLFLVSAHAMAVVAAVYMMAGGFSWWTLALAIAWFFLCGFSITAGYHRLFAHRSYEARPLVRALYLFFGAAAIQNSALNWCGDHRRHHARTDTPQDPYNIRRGFWWAHIGWVLNECADRSNGGLPDLRRDPLVRFQNDHYLLLAVLSGGLLPLGLGYLWGDPIGAVLVVGFLRLVFQWHVTFAINSIAHMFGSQPYGDRTTARDSGWVALFTLGEGYHNFHHRFPADYRNGARWFHVDPTKWLIWTLSRLRMTMDLRRTEPARIDRARELSSMARSA